ncbi:MAG: hypothetical protein IPN84_04810 [Sphingomonadales bacterium]|nr:hypothetical protein [Sphingomonadales bacterium]
MKFDEALQHLKSAAQRAVGLPFADECLQIERTFRQRHQIAALDRCDEGVHVNPVVRGKQLDLVDLQTAKAVNFEDAIAIRFVRILLRVVPGFDRRAVRKILLHQRPIGQGLPRIFAAGDNDPRTLTSNLNACAEDPDGIFERAGCAELRFIDRIEKEERFSVASQPLRKFSCTPDFKCLVERRIDSLDPDEEGLGTFLAQFGGAVLGFERLASAGISQHEDTVVLFEFAPSLHAAAGFGMQKFPIAEQWLGRDKPANQWDDNILHVRVPALAG